MKIIMESLFLFIESNAQYCHWIVFSLLMLAGLNFPISEDLLIIASGIIASTLVPENTWKIFLGIFMGAYLSDCMAYWIGRLWGGRLWKIKWLSKLFRQERLKQIERYYARYGILTLLIGRFIPFGVRNCLFVTAGIGKMNFGKFLFGDAIACICSNVMLFSLAYFCGKNIAVLVNYVNVIIFFTFLVALIGFIWYKKRKSVSSVD